MLFGLGGLVIYILPGLVIIWAAALAYGLVEGFSTMGWVIFGIETILMAGGSLVDNIMMGTSARQSGASWQSVGAALLLGLAGSLAWPPFGGLPAALIGLFAVEFYRQRNWRRALRSTRSMAIGCGWAAVIRFGVGIVMIALWGWWVISIRT
jgi:uncharacterized protein YqgC (DUF456 family)